MPSPDRAAPECRRAAPPLDRRRTRVLERAGAVSSRRLVQQHAQVVRDGLWGRLGRLEEEPQAPGRIEHVDLRRMVDGVGALFVRLVGAVVTLEFTHGSLGSGFVAVEAEK